MTYDSRPWHEVMSDDSGQLMVESVLLIGLVLMPFILLVTPIVQMLDTYYYRIAGVISLPFP